VTSRAEMESTGFSQSRGYLGNLQPHHHLLQLCKINLNCLVVIFNSSSVYLDFLRNQSGRKEGTRFHSSNTFQTFKLVAVQICCRIVYTSTRGMIPDADPSLRRRHQRRCPKRNSTLVFGITWILKS